MEDFTHLHLHTTYSMLDGAIRIPDLMKKLKDTGMSSVAITDHGNMYGAIEFYNQVLLCRIRIKTPVQWIIDFFLIPSMDRQAYLKVP